MNNAAILARAINKKIEHLKLKIKQKLYNKNKRNSFAHSCFPASPAGKPSGPFACVTMPLNLGRERAGVGVGLDGKSWSDPISNFSEISVRFLLLKR